MTWPDTVPPYKVSEDMSRFKYSCVYDECLTCWRNGQAPRRQYCQIINGTQGGAVDSVVQVQIRECNRFESVTPP
ncbi:hypothetical protein ACE6H2_021573 [Prunus campanulata]